MPLWSKNGISSKTEYCDPLMSKLLRTPPTLEEANRIFQGLTMPKDSDCCEKDFIIEEPGSINMYVKTMDNESRLAFNLPFLGGWHILFETLSLEPDFCRGLCHLLNYMDVLPDDLHDRIVKLGRMKVTDDMKQHRTSWSGGALSPQTRE